MLAGIGMLPEMMTGSEEYHEQLQQGAFEKSLQVPSCIC